MTRADFAERIRLVHALSEVGAGTGFHPDGSEGGYFDTTRLDGGRILFSDDAEPVHREPGKTWQQLYDLAAVEQWPAATFERLSALRWEPERPKPPLTALGSVLDGVEGER